MLNVFRLETRNKKQETRNKKQETRNKKPNLKNISKRTWFMIAAALVTIIGLVTGWYFFIFLVFPFGWGAFGGKDQDKE